EGREFDQLRSGMAEQRQIAFVDEAESFVAGNCDLHGRRRRLLASRQLKYVPGAGNRPEHADVDRTPDYLDKMIQVLGGKLVLLGSQQPLMPGRNLQPAVTKYGADNADRGDGCFNCFLQDAG